MQKRIVHMLNAMGMGGIENFIMNVYRNLDRENYQFDFILQNEAESIFEAEIRNLGGRIYKIPRFEKNPLKHMSELKKILKENQYIAFHRHTANSVVFVDLMVAKLAGIKNIIVHSHNTMHPQKSLNIFCIPILYALADEHFACGEDAGKWLYGSREFEVIYNGIEIAKYAYSEETRLECRKEIGLSEDDIVLGHIGRFSEQKNHKFLVEMFKELSKLNDKYKLILCGDGELREEIALYCKEKELDNKVIFLGIRKDVNKVLQAMDAFVFPSKYEGLPVSLIETQLTSLPCFISNTITDEALYNKNIVKLGIEESDKEEWCKQIMALPITTEYRSYINEDLYNDYEIKNIVKKLCEIYENR